MLKDFNLKKIMCLVNLNIYNNKQNKNTFKKIKSMSLFLQKVVPFVYKIHNYSLGVVLTRRVFCKKSIRRE